MEVTRLGRLDLKLRWGAWVPRRVAIAEKPLADVLADHLAALGTPERVSVHVCLSRGAARQMDEDRTPTALKVCITIAWLDLEAIASAGGVMCTVVPSCPDHSSFQLS